MQLTAVLLALILGVLALILGVLLFGPHAILALLALVAALAVAGWLAEGVAAWIIDIVRDPKAVAVVLIVLLLVAASYGLRSIGY